MTPLPECIPVVKWHMTVNARNLGALLGITLYFLEQQLIHDLRAARGSLAL